MRSSSTNLPRVGPPGPLGRLITILRSVFDCNSVVQEGCLKFGGSPFILPTIGGDTIILGPSAVGTLRKSDDSVFNGPERAKQLFQINLQFGDITTNPYHLETILRSDLTKALRRLTPDLRDEIQIVLPEKLGGLDSTSRAIPVFDTMLGIVARVVSRAMIGNPGCRDEAFLAAQSKLATTVISFAQVINWFPNFLKSTVFKTLITIFGGGVRNVEPLLTPYVKDRIGYAQQDNPETITDILLTFAPEEDLLQPHLVATRVAHLLMASIHTSAIFVTQALFELALLPSDQLSDIRSEIQKAIADEGGVCNKAAVGKFHKLDSLLKEIGRWHPLFAIGMSRVTLSDVTLSDLRGERFHIPKGSVVAIAPRATHLDPEKYPDPEVFDPFRFSTLRQQIPEGGLEGRHAFTALSDDYLLFGAGKHACPGRFFAALMIKLILAEIILNYDVTYPEGKKERPKSIPFNLFTTPNPWAKLYFTRRVS